MSRFVEGVNRGQNSLFPECLQDWIGEDNPVRVIDVFVEELDQAELGFGGADRICYKKITLRLMPHRLQCLCRVIN